MRLYSSCSRCAFWIFAFSFIPLCSWADDAPALQIDTLQVRIRIASAQQAIELTTPAAVRVTSPKGSKELPSGAYTVRASAITPPGRRYHLFIKTFQPSESAQAQEFMAQWMAQGYAPEIVVFGRKLGAASGAVVDNRSLWISLARLDSLDQANALTARLETQKVWGWVVSETLGRGAATLTIDSGGKNIAQGTAPFAFQSDAPLEVANVDRGFWKARSSSVKFSGTLEIAPGPEGQLDLVEIVPVEEYLAGVLPAEMPADWPAQALEAQAIAARTEVFAALGGKHMLDGFDFCATEHCRAYGACAARRPSSDAAIQATRGAVITSGGRFVPTVFSANCGGCTEDNDAVWSSPTNSALRARLDLPRENKKDSWQQAGIAAWLKRPPHAYCDHRRDNFRWNKKFSVQELSSLVNKNYKVGTVRAIEPVDRGTGGRITAIKITGDAGSTVVRKELNIRLAFGGLPSAMFMVEAVQGANGPSSFTFIGGGRGHGVGLCQDGACGMARAGKSSIEILRHYFSNVEIIRFH